MEWIFLAPGRDDGDEGDEKPSLVRLVFGVVCFCAFPVLVTAAGIDGDVERQSLNPLAILIFFLFVVTTLFITYWAAKKTSTSSTFYNAGGKITGLQNGTAIAGDFMSAASLLGITGLIFIGGFDGLVLGLGAFTGWPIMLFLLASGFSE